MGPALPARRRRPPVGGDAPQARRGGRQKYPSFLRFSIEASDVLSSMRVAPRSLTSAATADDIVIETLAAEVSERGATRMDDKTSDASMEKRKKDGYF